MRETKHEDHKTKSSIFDFRSGCAPLYTQVSSGKLRLRPGRCRNPGRVRAPRLAIAPGPFKGTRDSLREWQLPDWYRDAKFGIWAHWGPQSAVEYGDWYARNMYIQGNNQYEYHVKTYGHPTKVGFKDLFPTWKADKFDPDHLLGLYKKAGAKYFCSMAVHHDGFDLWDSKLSAALERCRHGAEARHRRRIQESGPESRAALRGKRAPSLPAINWFSTSHHERQDWPSRRCALRWRRPRFRRSLSRTAEVLFYSEQILQRPARRPTHWKQHYFNRIKDLVDKYQPDLLYTDGDISFRGVRPGTGSEPV